MTSRTRNIILNAIDVIGGVGIVFTVAVILWTLPDLF